MSKPVAVSTQQIQGEQRVLHALNRFTFGPRPGDIAAVQAMGLKRWFEQQLNPSSIDDSALECAAGDVSCDEDVAGGDDSAVSEPAGVAADDCEESCRCRRTRWNMRSMPMRSLSTKLQKAKQEAKKAEDAQSGRVMRDDVARRWQRTRGGSDEERRCREMVWIRRFRRWRRMRSSFIRGLRR